jgi:PAS domain-containing protein
MRWRRKAAQALARGYAGMRVSRSTLLRSRAGKLLGLSSTHFQSQQCPSERELQLIDLYTRLTTQISERRRTRAALERSEAYLAEAQRLSHTGSWAYNPVSGEMFWSLEHFRIFGLAPGDIKPCFELFLKTIHSEDRPRIKQLFDTPAGAARDYETEYRIVRPDGAIRHLQAIGHPVLTADEISEWVGTVIDVTSQDPGATFYFTLPADQGGR